MKKYLVQALDSVIAQQYPNLELIIMDGGSTDGTIDVIKQYKQYITYWKSEKDKGHCDACNKGIDIATGDFIEFLNADDFLGAGLLHKVANVYADKPHAKIISCGVHIIETSSSGQSCIIQKLDDINKLQISLHNMTLELPVINARFFHKDIFKQFGKFQPTLADGSYNMTNDREFLIKLALANVQSELIADVFYNYLSHENSLTFSMKNQLRTRNEHIKLANHFLSTYCLTSSQKTLFKKWIAKDTTYLFLSYLIHRDIKKALHIMLLGIRECGYLWLLNLTKVIITTTYKRIIKFITSKGNTEKNASITIS